MPKLCPLCGPMASAFCMVMSVWGVIFLGLLGVFFYLQAVTLFPDIHFEMTKGATSFPVKDIEEKYNDKAIQCWIAAGMYAVTLVIVFWQNKFNSSSAI
ncbi:unnamed protein product, partial [Mesorhabditis spiculigera]